LRADAMGISTADARKSSSNLEYEFNLQTFRMEVAESQSALQIWVEENKLRHFLDRDFLPEGRIDGGNESYLLRLISTHRRRHFDRYQRGRQLAFRCRFLDQSSARLAQQARQVLAIVSRSQ
jgi:hypothetical protein